MSHLCSHANTNGNARMHSRLCLLARARGGEWKRWVRTGGEGVRTGTVVGMLNEGCVTECRQRNEVRRCANGWGQRGWRRWGCT